MQRYNQRNGIGQCAARVSRLAAQAITAILLLLAVAPVGAQLGTVAPYPNPPYLDASGNPCALCTINSYVTGASSTPLDTFTTAALAVANANPIVLDAAGQASVYLTPGLTYRFVLKTAAGATLWTRDGIAGPNGVAADRLRFSAHAATIATGAFTATYSQYSLDTEGAAATDDLDTIAAGTGVGVGTLLLVTPANVSHVVTAKDSTGNLKLGGGDYALDSAKKSLTLYYDGSNWVEVARAGATTVDVGVVEGRLTLTSGTPVTTADVTAATSIYYAPYKGNRIALYDGSIWAIFTFTEKTLALGTLTNALPYDVFLYSNSGTLTLEALAWTNGTTRATALTTQDGVLVKTGAATRRYLGTFYTTATTTTEDSFAKRLLWNYYNRVRRDLRVTEATDTWTYETAAWHQANASTANQLAVVVGVAEVPIRVEVRAHVGNASGAAKVVYGGIGEDLTNAIATGSLATRFDLLNGASADLTPSLAKYPAVGFHFYSWLEYGVASLGAGAWVGDGGAATLQQSGIVGWIDG